MVQPMAAGVLHVRYSTFWGDGRAYTGVYLGSRGRADDLRPPWLLFLPLHVY